jgi:hypothetical protein
MMETLAMRNYYASEHVNTKDAYFAMLGFTTASSEAVMCSIIFAASQLDSLWVQGLDPFATWEEEEFEMEKNIGKGKWHPQPSMPMLLLLI